MTFPAHSVENKARYGLIMSFVFRSPGYYVGRYAISRGRRRIHSPFTPTIYLYRMPDVRGRFAYFMKHSKQTLLSLSTQLLLLPTPKPFLGMFSVIILLFGKKPSIYHRDESTRCVCDILCNIQIPCSQAVHSIV